MFKISPQVHKSSGYAVLATTPKPISQVNNTSSANTTFTRNSVTDASTWVLNDVVSNDIAVTSDDYWGLINSVGTNSLTVNEWVNKHSKVSGIPQNGARVTVHRLGLVESLTIKAMTSNTANIYVGVYGDATTNDLVLEKGSSLTLRYGSEDLDVTRVYARSASGTQYATYIQGASGAGMTEAGGAGALQADGSVPLIANWDAGNYQIASNTFRSKVSTGTAPLAVASTTMVSNLNSDTVDGYHASELLSGGLDLWYNVKDYGATGNGTTDDRAAIQSAINAIGSAYGTLLFPRGTYLITDNITIGANIKVMVETGAMIRPTFGKVLTINGNLSAGLYQIFDMFSGVFNRQTSTDDGLFNGVGAWTVGTGWAISGGTANHTTGNTGTLSYANCAGVSGRTFVVKYTIGGSPNGGIIPSIGGVSGYRRTTAGTYVDLITATGTGALTFTPETNFGGTLDNVEVYMLGTHVLGAGSVSEVVPQWWGAKGDDSTDNSIVFMHALKAWENIGNMYIPSGTYRTTSPVKGFPTHFNTNLTPAKIIRGSGIGNTILKYVGTDSSYCLELTSDMPSVLGGSNPYSSRVVNQLGLEEFQIQANSTTGGGILIGGAFTPKLNRIGIRSVANGNGIMVRSGEANMRSTGRVNDTDREFTSTRKYAIAFTPLTAGFVKSLRVRLKRTGSPSGTITASIYTDSSGVPGSQVGVTSDAVSCSALSTSIDGAEQEFVFNITQSGENNNYPYVTATQFWVVLETTATSGVFLRTKANDTSNKFGIHEGSWTTANDGSDLVVVVRYGSGQSLYPILSNSYIGPSSGSDMVNNSLYIDDIGQMMVNNCTIRGYNGAILRGGPLFWVMHSEFSNNDSGKIIDFIGSGQTRYTQTYLEPSTLEFKGGRHTFTSCSLGVYPTWSQGAIVHVDRGSNGFLSRADDPTFMFDTNFIVPANDSRLRILGTTLVTDASALSGFAMQASAQNNNCRLDFSANYIRWLLPRGTYLCTVWAKDTNQVTNDFRFYSGYYDSGGAPITVNNLQYTLTSSYRPYRVLLHVTSSMATIGRGVFFGFYKSSTGTNTILVSHFIVQRLGGGVALDTLYTADLVAHNTETSDSDNARDSSIFFIGRKADGVQSALSQIRASHDGSGADEKGKLEFLVNDGDDRFAPTRMMTLSSSGLILGSAGSAIRQIAVGAISVDPPSISGNSQGTVTFTLTGVAVGDRVIMEPPTDLNSGLVFKGARVTSSNTVTIYLHNVTGSPIDDTSRSWNYTWIDMT